jgi:hypothetical protein
MVGPPPDGLEARVARLERLLDRVLARLQELQTGSEIQLEEAGGEAPWEVPQAGITAATEEVGGEATEDVEDGVPGVEEDGVPEEASGPAAGGQTKPREGLSFLTDLGILAPGGTFLSRLGIGLLLLSVVFFFKYSIDQGWLTEWVRLAIGVIAGITLVALGFRGASKGEPLGTVLAGGGIATFFITGFVGHQWFELVSYPVAFGFLVAASGLGIFLALKSGLQALAVVGLIGALGTPLLLTAPTTEVAGLALYVSLIVASVAAIYMARAWRAVFLMAVVTAWLVLSAAVSQAAVSPGNSAWVVQGAIAFCALVFWLVPLLRTELRARSPGRWLRPESAYAESGDEGGIAPETAGSWLELGRKSAAGTPYVPWNAHLDALSLLMPMVGITLSAWLWDLSRLQLGWAFLGTALLAQGVGSWISRSQDPEDSASTQRFVAILLSTVGLGLVLTGDILYLALIAEAVALFTVGSRKGSWVVMGLGGVVELLVLGLFLFRLVFGGTLLEGDFSSLFDLAAIGGAAFIGIRLKSPAVRQGFFIGAYLGLLAFTGRELSGHTSFLYLAYLVEAVATQMVAARRKSQLLEGLGYVALGLGVTFFVFGIQSGRTLLEGDLTSLVDFAAVLGVAYMGILASTPEIRRGLFAGAYLGLLAFTGRELSGHTWFLYLAFILTAVVTRVVALSRKSSLFSALGHVPVFVVLGLFWSRMGTPFSLWAGDLTSLVDLAALGAAAYIGTLLTGRQGRQLYLFGAYVGLLAWTTRELYPFEQGQALMSLAFGVEGTVLLVAGLLKNRSVLHQTGMATLLLVVVKVLLVDLAAVEPVWRVLLLFLFAVLFLVLSKVVQGRRMLRNER